MPRKVDPLAGRYYRITPRFWQDRDVRAWPEDARWLAIYLMTCPHRNMIGLYYCPMSYITADMQWSNERLDKAFAVLVDAGFAQYDHGAQVVHIVKLLKNDPLVNENQAKSAVKAILALPKTELVVGLYNAALAYCEVLAHIMEQDIPDLVQPMYYQGTFIRETRIPYTVYRTETNASEDSRVSEDPTMQEPVEDAPKRITKPRPPSYEELTVGFEEFWQVYPRKIDRGRSLKQWVARLRDKQNPVTPEQLLKSAENFAKYHFDKGTDTQYIMYPARFLGPSLVYKEYLEPVALPAGMTKEKYERIQREAAIEAQKKTQQFLQDILGVDPSKGGK